MPKIKLGEEVKDIVSGFKGVVTTRVEYLTGVPRCGVEALISSDGRPNMEYFDETRLEPTGVTLNVPA